MPKTQETKGPEKIHVSKHCFTCSSSLVSIIVGLIVYRKACLVLLTGILNAYLKPNISLWKKHLRKWIVQFFLLYESTFVPIPKLQKAIIQPVCIIVYHCCIIFPGEGYCNTYTHSKKRKERIETPPPPPPNNLRPS